MGLIHGDDGSAANRLEIADTAHLYGAAVDVLVNNLSLTGAANWRSKREQYRAVQGHGTHSCRRCLVGVTPIAETRLLGDSCG